MNDKEKFNKETEKYFEQENLELGPWTSESMVNDPKHLAFVLSRYKFVAKMLEGRESVLEVGCGDAFGVPVVAQAVGRLYTIDWEERLINDNLKRLHFLNNVEFIQSDINLAPISTVTVDAIYNIDFIEHLNPRQEEQVMKNMVASYAKKEDAVMIIGTPNLSAAKYASPQSEALHINLKSYDTLKELLGRYFYNVFMFDMNDEVLHTGYAPMCQYLWGIGVGLKSVGEYLGWGSKHSNFMGNGGLQKE